RALQTSWWQELGAAHDGGPRAQQAGKLETWALFAGSQGGTVAPAGGNACAPRSVRLDLKAPRVPRSDTATPDHLSHRHRCQWQGREGRAQQPAMPVIGFIRPSPPESAAHLLPAFRAGLKEIGFVEGQNVAIEYRWPDLQDDRLRETAAELVRRQ